MDNIIRELQQSLQMVNQFLDLKLFKIDGQDFLQPNELLKLNVVDQTQLKSNLAFPNQQLKWDIFGYKYETLEKVWK